MELESYFESCGACGFRTIHFVIDPPIIRRQCANCGRDNSTTWGSHRLPEYQGPAFDRVLERLTRPSQLLKIKFGTPPPWSEWDSLSAFEKSRHCSIEALKQ
jgi:hypothetical protein